MSPDTETRKRKRHCFTRSKAGCQVCRKQKKKCDEERPACGRCKAFGKECVWAGVESPGAGSSGSGPPSLRREPYVPEGSREDRAGFEHGHEHEPDVQGAAISPVFSVPTLAYPAPIPTTHTDYPNWLLNGVDPTLTLSLLPSAGPDHAPAISPMADSAPSTALPDFGDAFWDTFFGPLTQPVIPLPDFSPTVATSNPTRQRQSGAVLSVPLTCDSSLWSSFVDSSLWDSRQVTGSSGSLLEHFSTFASTTIVVRNNPTSASAFFAQLADKATEDNQTALMHAVLCTSAVHLANWAAKVDDQIKGVHFAELAAQHRAQALHLLRIASAKQEEYDEEVNAATMVLLLLSGVLRGDTDVMPSFLQRTSTMLHRISKPRVETLLPSVSALHSMYTGLHFMASGKQVDIGALFPRMDDREIWEERSQEVCESVMGIRKDMFLLLVRVNTLIVEHDTIAEALKRDQSDDELSMMQIELHSECSTIESQLKNEAQWTASYVTGCVERTRIGHECFRIAIQMLIIREMFKYDSGHPRVRALTTNLLEWLEKCPLGTEIGLLYPYIIVGSEADEKHYDRYRAFSQRCTWKGSAPPRVSGETVEEVWRRNQRGKNVSWRTILLEKGSPVLV